MSLSHLPPVKLLDHFRSYGIQDPDELGKRHLEHPNLVVVHDVNNEQLKRLYPQ